MNKRPANKGTITAETYRTIPDFLAGVAVAYGESPALSWFTRSRQRQSYTYNELAGRVKAVARALTDRALAGPQAHVAIVSENSAGWIIAFLALGSCGATAVCVDVDQAEESIRDMVRRSHCRSIFLSPAYLPICLPLLEEGRVEHIILMDGLSSEERVDHMDQLYSQGRAALERGGSPDPGGAEPERTAEIVFTSGTTAQSKMVMLSQDNVLQNVRDAVSYVDLYQRVFCSLPFYHAYGLNCGVLSALLHGAHLFINGDLRTMSRDFRLAEADTMMAVPLMAEALLDQLWLAADRAGQAPKLRRLLRQAARCRKLHLPFHSQALADFKEQVWGRLRLIISGGAHLDPAVAEEFQLWGVLVLQGYGITECSPLISVNCNDCYKLGSVGLPLPGCELRLEQGQIWVRGPGVMQGYYQDPEQTAAALEEGWFKTGDLGYLDKDGFLYITGRQKNLIVFKNGKKASPEKLEQLISRLPLVGEVMVYGAAGGASADDVKITASVYPDPERSQGLSSYEILEQLQAGIDRINDQLPSYQQIQLVNIREKEFAKTSSRKIKRYSN